jgi:hypothetical protein
MERGLPVSPFRIAALSGTDLQLPAPRRFEVKSGSADAVEMILYCAPDETSETLTPVSVELQPAFARELAIKLWLAADETETPAK